MVIYRLGLPYYKEFDNFRFLGMNESAQQNGICGDMVWQKHKKKYNYC